MAVAPGVIKIHTTPDFNKSFRRLPPPIKVAFTRKEQWFLANSFDPRLKTHKLAGELKNLWSYSINYQYRVLFRFFSAHEVIYFDVGTHEIYRR